MSDWTGPSGAGGERPAGPGDDGKEGWVGDEPGLAPDEEGGPGDEPRIAAVEFPIDLEQERERRRVRLATHADLPAVAEGVTELLAELGGSPAPIDELMRTARELLEEPQAGAVIVAEDDGRLVGLLGVSWQKAIRTAGRYGLIQELWVRPEHRYLEIGADLLTAVADLARFRGIGRLEVGLPGESYPHAVATESFYANNGFVGIGLRMRRVL